MTRDEGVYPITIASGEIRYQAVAKIKGGFHPPGLVDYTRTGHEKVQGGNRT